MCQGSTRPWREFYNCMPVPRQIFITWRPQLKRMYTLGCRGFLPALYGIVLQWEIHCHVITWGEGHVDFTDGRVGLTCKGAILDLGECSEECHMWVDVHNTNAKFCGGNIWSLRRFKSACGVPPREWTRGPMWPMS